MQVMAPSLAMPRPLLPIPFILLALFILLWSTVLPTMEPLVLVLEKLLAVPMLISLILLLH